MPRCTNVLLIDGTFNNEKEPLIMLLPVSCGILRRGRLHCSWSCLLECAHPTQQHPRACMTPLMLRARRQLLATTRARCLVRTSAPHARCAVHTR